MSPLRINHTVSKPSVKIFFESTGKWEYGLVLADSKGLLLILGVYNSRVSM